MLGNAQWPLAALVALACLPAGCRQATSEVSLERPAESTETVEETWPDGRLRLRRDVLRTADGTRIDHGTYTCWYDNGRKEYEATFILGKIHGSATRWHRNGQKAVEEHFVYGKRHGMRCTWDENGVKRKEEHHVDDKPDGTWTVWDKRGRVKWQGRFDRGVPES